MSVSSKQSSMKSIDSSEDITNITQARESTLKQLNKVLRGNADLDEVDAFCKVMNTVLNTLKVEMAYLKMIQNDHRINFISNNSKLIEKKD